MSDDFIPLNQSTPVGGNKWQGRHNTSRNQYQNHHSQNSQRRGYNNRWGNNSQRNNSWGNNSQRNSSYGSDSNNSFSNEKSNIDAYLHPSMLQDPWAQLRSKQDDTK